MRRLVRLVFFVASALLALLALLLTRIMGRRPHVHDWIYKTWRRSFLWAMGIRVVSRGSEYNGPALMVANHRSYADVLFVHSPLPVVFLSKAEVRNWPLIGWAARALDTVFVDRSINTASSTERGVGSIDNHLSITFKDILFANGNVYIWVLFPIHYKVINRGLDPLSFRHLSPSRTCVCM